MPPGGLRDLEQPQLIVDELVLRPLEPRDAARVAEAYRDPAIRKWHARSMPETEALSWGMSWSERWRAETGVCWAVADSDLLVGRVGLRTLDLAEGAGEAVYWVMPDARGRGVATRARGGIGNPLSSRRLGHIDGSGLLLSCALATLLTGRTSKSARLTRVDE